MVKSVIVFERAPKRFAYPCLLKDKTNGNVILAAHENERMIVGTIISTKDNPKLIGLCTGWPYDNFISFEGDVTLRND